MYTIRLPLTGLPRGVYNARIRYRVSVQGRPFRRGTRVAPPRVLRQPQGRVRRRPQPIQHRHHLNAEPRTNKPWSSASSTTTASPRMDAGNGHFSTNNHGYGQMSYKGAMRKVHRLAWWAFRDEIPPSVDLDHICRNRRCFNPDHLRPCTRRENLLAPGSRSPSAIHAVQTHCQHGHPLEGENFYVMPNGRRECRTCRREQRLRYREQHGHW